MTETTTYKYPPVKLGDKVVYRGSLDRAQGEICVVAHIPSDNPDGRGYFLSLGYELESGSDTLTYVDRSSFKSLSELASEIAHLAGDMERLARESEKRYWE